LDNAPHPEQQTAPAARKPPVFLKPVTYGVGFMVVLLAMVIYQATHTARPQPPAVSVPTPPSGDQLGAPSAYTPAPQTAAMPAPTDAQTQAMRSVPANGRGPAGPSPREEARARRIKALQSDSIVVADEHDAGEVAAAALPTKEETQPPSAPLTSAQQSQQAARFDPWDTANGRSYKLFEGKTVFECVLLNRLEGEFTGPVKVMLTNNFYSNSFQKLLIPAGTIFLGEATKVGSSSQTRLAVAFHRMIMPDGFSLSLDHDPALDQAGATGLHDKVNRHYLRTFGLSIAIGALGASAQIGNGGYGGFSGIRNGISETTSQEAVQILDHYLNEVPRVTVREGTRVRIWLTKDLDVPEYGAHTVDPNL
jgi:type IV secretion system protein TrbI